MSTCARRLVDAWLHMSQGHTEKTRHYSFPVFNVCIVYIYILFFRDGWACPQLNKFIEMECANSVLWSTFVREHEGGRSELIKGKA